METEDDPKSVSWEVDIDLLEELDVLRPPQLEEGDTVEIKFIG